jgi:hypothetical protein
VTSILSFSHTHIHALARATEVTNRNEILIGHRRKDFGDGEDVDVIEVAKDLDFPKHPARLRDCVHFLGALGSRAISLEAKKVQVKRAMASNGKRQLATQRTPPLQSTRHESPPRTPPLFTRTQFYTDRCCPGPCLSLSPRSTPLIRHLSPTTRATLDYI